VPPPALPWLTCRDRDGANLWRIAVRADGRRAADHASLDDLPASLAANRDGDVVADTVVLDHAGPAASRHAVERSVALVGTPVDPVSQRRARPLDDDERSALIAAFADGARRVRASGRRVVVAIDDDGLLHRGLSPIGGAPDVELVLRVIAACAPCDLRLVIEDLAPGGLDASAGIAFARRAVDVAGATRIIASGGTAAFDPLWSRRKGRSVDTSGLSLASAAWLVGRLAVPVLGLVRGTVDIEVVMTRARRLGLAGVVHVDDVA
jgi:hypothetical protein